MMLEQIEWSFAAAHGVGIFPGEVLQRSRHWAERRFADLRHYSQPERGGYFVAMENLHAITLRL